MRPGRARARRVGTGIVGLLVSAAAVAVLATVIDIGATAETLGRTKIGRASCRERV